MKKEQAEPSVKKKKVTVTGDFMVNGSSKKILEKLDVTKEKSDDLIIQKNLTDTNARLKNFYMQKGIGFINKSGFKEFHLVKRRFHLNRKGSSAFAKNLLHHINRKD